ncbi:MAG TPA: VanW family protein [Kofleriaceae bacterium]|jgi:vancomycin resistance protein YoaR|nr:VanW family protein [Kofleriaceae bacterium]
MSTRFGQRGAGNPAVLLGLAGTLLVAAGGLAGGYYVVSTRSEARAANRPADKSAKAQPDQQKAGTAKPSPALEALLTKSVDVKTGSGTAKLTWADLGVEIDQAELGRSPVGSDAELTALAAKGSIPVRLDRDKAVKALMQLKGQYDRGAIDAYLDLEERKINDDSPGQGIDVWASLQRIETGARQASPSIELVAIPVPARVTKQGLGIEDISNVLGVYETKFAVADKDRNFNLKLAASHINGAVLKPNEEWSFNGTVGERSQATGYKVAHVITAGEMVDGLAGGTCQISTTLFGASFFAGLDIVKTTNHSRPSAYTPLGFDATVVWPNTDLVLKNPYDFPVAVLYRVANGIAHVEILGKKRPWTKVEFVREVLEETQYNSEERVDDEMPEGQTMLDQQGFNGYKLKRYRRFYTGKKMVKENKWTVQYKPVTEYIRRGTNPDPNTPMPKEKDLHPLKPPKPEDFNKERTVLTQ